MFWLIFFIVYILGLGASGWLWLNIAKEESEEYDYQSKEDYYNIPILVIIKGIFASLLSWIGVIWAFIYADENNINPTITIKPKK